MNRDFLKGMYGGIVQLCACSKLLAVLPKTSRIGRLLPQMFWFKSTSQNFSPSPQRLGKAQQPPTGVVMCRSSPRGHLIVASARDPLVLGKVLLYFVSKQMEIVQLQSIGWSDPLGNLAQ